LRNPHAGDGWNAVFDRGIFAGVICPDCQTPMENAEAEINLATLDYDRGITVDGRVYAPVKHGDDSAGMDGWAR